MSGYDLYVGGWFTHLSLADGTDLPAIGVAKLNTATGVWSAVGDNSLSPDDVVQAVVVDAQGRVYVGGTSSSSPYPGNMIKVWDGATWSIVGGGLLGDGGVSEPFGITAMATDGANVFVGGSFDGGGNVVSPYLIKWTGTAWSGMGTPGLFAPQSMHGIYSIAVSSGRVLVAGSFSGSAGPSPMGFAWFATGGGYLSDGQVSFMDNQPGGQGGCAYAQDGRFYLAGMFTGIGDFSSGPEITSYGIAQWSNNKWSPVGLGTELMFNDYGTLWPAILWSVAADQGAVYVFGNQNELHIGTDVQLVDNAVRYVTGSDPDPIHSCSVAFSDLLYDHGLFSFKITGQAGSHWFVVYKDDLLDPDWHPMTDLQAVGAVTLWDGTARFTDTTASQVPYRFYDVTNYCCPIGGGSGRITYTRSCTPVPSGLIGFWPGEGSADDMVGGQAGTVQGGVTYGPAKVGLGFVMNGTDGRVLVPGATSLNFGPGADFSIEAWIQPIPAYSQWGVQEIACKRYAPNDSSAVGYEFDLVNGRVCCQLADAPLGSGMSTFGPQGPDLRDGTFHHVAMTVSRNSTTGGNLYVDGVSVLTFDPTSQAGDLSNNQPFRIGNHATPGRNCFFKGGIDEVSIYGRALSAGEVQATYSAGAGGKCVVPAPPMITTQPASQNALLGATVTFSAAATGCTPLSYQWLFNGAAISGGTGSSLVIPNVQLTTAGQYAVSVVNAAGVAVSAPAQLTVSPSETTYGPAMLAWWQFERNANDTLGNVNGTDSGIDYITGKVGYAGKSDTGGSGQQHIDLGDPSMLHNLGNGPCSIECWVLLDDNYANHRFHGNGILSYDNGGWGVGIYSLDLGGVLYWTTVGYDGVLSSSFFTAANYNQPHHLAFTLDPANHSAQFYFDGAPDPAGPYVYDPLFYEQGNQGTDLYILGQLGGGNAQYQGAIDELSIYNRKLTDTEVLEIYNRGFAGQPKLP